MTGPRDLAHLADMIGFVRELRSMALAPSEAEFVADRIRCLAAEKLFINLGEASIRIGETTSRFSQVPWRRMIGLRNILAHGYNVIAHEVLYRTITIELPSVESGWMEVVRSLDPDGLL